MSLINSRFVGAARTACRRFVTRAFSSKGTPFRLDSQGNPKQGKEDVTPFTALVMGSSGALGLAVTRHLKREMDCQVIGADVRPDGDENPFLDAYVHLPDTPSLPELCEALTQELDPHLMHMETKYQKTSEKSQGESYGLLDAVICANGGWQADDKANPSHGAVVMQSMLQVNLHPVLAVSNVIVPHRCAPRALCVVMGATAALQGTPGMMAYGVSKAATHHLVQSMGGLSTATLGPKHKVKGAIPGITGGASHNYPITIGILPTTLDTPSNRNHMPYAPTWTNCDDVAAQIGTWMQQPSLRPAPGSLVKVHTDLTTGEAVFELVR